MKIEHLAIWVSDLDTMKKFYVDLFNGEAGELYVNPKKKFSSYFLSFDSGSRLELMHRPEMAKILKNGQETMGLTHFAISVGSKEAVHSLTETIRSKGYSIVGEPRTTGDGYYESVVLDPEGNRIEITI